MAEVTHWEKLFVERYIVPDKKDRYLGKLKGPKHRSEILDRLNHALDYRSDLAVSIPQKDRTQSNLIQLLRTERVAATCYIMADGNENDGLELRLERAIEELFGNTFGFIIICPPVPIAIYKEEDIGDMILLKPRKT